MRMLPPGLIQQSSGIASLLQPLLGVVSREYQQDVIDPYVQEVERLTTTTFPNVQFGNTGLGGRPSVVGNPIQNPFPNPFGTGGGGMFPPGFDPSHVINPLKNPFDGTGPVLQTQPQGVMGVLGATGLGPLRGSM